MPNDKNKQNTGEITADEILSKLKKQIGAKEADSEKQSDSQDELEITREKVSGVEIKKEQIKTASPAKNVPEPDNEKSVEDDSELDIEALLKKYLPEEKRPEKKTVKSDTVLFPDADIDEDIAAYDFILDDLARSSVKKPFTGTASKVDTSDIPLSRIGKAQMTEYIPGEAESEEPEVKKTSDSDNEFILEDDEVIEDPFDDEFNEAPKRKSLFSSFGLKEKKNKKQQIADSENVNVSKSDREITLEESGGTADTDKGEDLYELTPPDGSAYDDAAVDEEYSEDNLQAEEETKLLSGKKIKFQKQKRVKEASEDESEEAETKEIDKSDINLMVALGLEEELEKTVSGDKVSELEAELEEKSSRIKKYVNDEYIDRSQTKKIADAYKYAHVSTKVKLLCAVILSLILLVYENIGITGMQFGGFNDPAIYPVVYIMIDLQILLLCAAMAYEQIFDGIKGLFTGKPVPESITAIMVFFGIVHSILESVYTVSPIEPHLYNFPVTLCVVMTLIYALYNIKREIFSFNVVSAKRSKFALTKLTASQSKVEAETFKDVIDDDGADIIKIEKASFIDGYFTRTNQPAPYTSVIAVIIPVVLAVAAVFFIISYTTVYSILTASTLAYVTMLFGFPVSMFFTYSYPFYKANKEAYENDSTIIGEVSLEEYADATIISFDDKNVFPSYGVKIHNMYIFDNNRIDRVLYYASSVFARVGGPLADVFEVATIEMEHSGDVKILSSEKGILEALVDGRSIMFGNKKALENIGIEIPEDIADDDRYGDADVCVMYLVRNGELMAKMFIKYVMDGDFEFILKQLAGSGMCVGIKTFDPNIDEDMIGRAVKIKKYPLKVLRGTVTDEKAETNEHVDSGIVSRGTTKSLLQTVSFCDRVLHVRKTNLIIKILAMSVSMVIVWLLAMYGGLGALRSVYIAVYQIFWLIPMMFTTRIFI